MPIENAIWYTKVGVFYALKAKHQKASLCTYFTVVLFYFIMFHLYRFHSVLNCVMTSYLRMSTKLPKIAKITIFLVLCISSLLFRCGEIEKNPGPKYPSLTFLSLEFKWSHIS